MKERIIKIIICVLIVAVILITLNIVFISKEQNSDTTDESVATQFDNLFEEYKSCDRIFDTYIDEFLTLAISKNVSESSPILSYLSESVQTLEILFRDNSITELDVLAYGTYFNDRNVIYSVCIVRHHTSTKIVTFIWKDNKIESVGIRVL